MAIRKLRNYVRGEWYEPRGARFIDVENPSTGETIAQVPLSSAEDTNAAIEAARAAFPGWARTPVDKRVAPLFKLAEMIRANREVLARSITEENGKSLTEAHPDVQGVSVVGSTPTARIVAETCARNNKRFQAMGGAKNHLVVMPDAKMDDVVRNMITSGYGCAGQRCMASSAIVCVGDAVYKDVSTRFVEASKKVIVGNPLDPKIENEPMVMGPVISAKAKEFILAMIETGLKEGATLALDGRGVRVPGGEKGHFIGTTVFTGVKPGMQIHKTEIFGPVQVILKAATLDEAIAIVNGHEYGNGASIYTQNGYYARKVKLEPQVRMVGVNVGIPAPVAYLPFGGMKSSQFADIKAQGKAIVNFFTQDKIVTERYWPEA